MTERPPQRILADPMELASAPSTIPAPRRSSAPPTSPAMLRSALYESACDAAENGTLCEAWVRQVGDQTPELLALPERELFAIVAVAWGIGTSQR